MCLNWRNKDQDVYDRSDLRFISQGKDKYGYPNNLNGCANDTRNLPEAFLQQFPITDVRRYFNYEFTGDRYIKRLRNGISVLDPGAIVCMIADSCYSETITRGNPSTGIVGVGGIHPTKNRYYPNPDIKLGIKTRRRIFSVEETRCIVISGCQEGQTSADAWFDKFNQYMGALSAALYVSISRGMTWQEWFDEAKRLVAIWGFEQIPTIAGPEAMRNRKIGDDQALIFHNSSHGSNLNDESGDEPDGKDETIYADRHIPDDEISRELDKITA